MLQKVFFIEFSFRIYKWTRDKNSWLTSKLHTIVDLLLRKRPHRPEVSLLWRREEYPEYEDLVSRSNNRTVRQTWVDRKQAFWKDFVEKNPAPVADDQSDEDCLKLQTSKLLMKTLIVLYRWRLKIRYWLKACSYRAIKIASWLFNLIINDGDDCSMFNMLNSRMVSR